MAGSLDTQRPQNVLPFRVPREGLAGWRHLNVVLGFILERMGFKLSFDGIDASEIPGGIHLKAHAGSDGGGDGSDFPFKCTYLGGNAIRVTPGTFAGVYPTIGGVSILATPLLAGSSGNVWLRVEYNLTSSAGGYVYASSFVSAIITLEGGDHSNPLGPSSRYFYILLATFSGGVKLAQNVQSSLAGNVCDAGALDGKADLTPVRS